MDLRIPIDEHTNWRRSELESQQVEYMEPALYEAAKEGQFDKVDKAVQQIPEAKQPSLHTILNQVSPSGNSLLHVAASYGRKEITQLLAREFPFLIIRPNYQGDTPLHVAARAGKLETTETLVNCAKDFPDVDSILRIKNENGNTALHEAVMKDNQQEVHFLVMSDKEVAYLANNEGESPLYLAAKLKTDAEAYLLTRQGKPTPSEKILPTLLQAIKADVNSLCKLEGKSPMHAIVESENLEMLKILVSSTPGLMQYKDEKERTALHCAASIGYVDGVRYLSEQFSHAALQKDKDGFYPIHLACENGHVEVVKELLKWWPDPTELLSYKGQNILHVAAANGRAVLVKFLIRTPLPGLDFDKLAREKDKDGNTPLHLATIRGQSFTVWTLRLDKSFKGLLNLKNNQGLRAYDIAEKQSQRDHSEDSKRPVILCGKDEKIVDEENLKANVVTAEKKSTIDAKSSKQPGLYDAMMTLSVLHVLQLNAVGYRSIVQNLNIKIKFPNEDDLKDRINTLMVVAALVAGITFSAAIQKPDRVGDPDEDQTTKTARVALFQLFILFDTVAMNFSIMGAILVFVSWAYLGDFNLGYFAVWAASVVVWFSLYTMVFAFFAAVVIAVIKDAVILWNIVMFEIMCVVAVTIFSIPMIFPIGWKHAFTPYIYFLIFFVTGVWRRAILDKCSHLINAIVARRPRKMPGCCLSSSFADESLTN